MARVTYGPLITAFSGSIGGITFQRNSSGNIARMRPAPPVVSSALQAAQQARLITTVNYWSKLTCQQKALWNQFAIDHPRTNDWGEIHTLNGLEWFMSVNLNLFDPVVCPSGDPPTWSVVEPLDPFVIISEPTVFNLYWSVEQVLTNSWVLVFVSRPNRTTTIQLRLNQFSLGQQPLIAGQTIELIEPYQNRFNVLWPDIISNQHSSIFVRVKVVNYITGLSSPFTSQIICF